MVEVAAVLECLPFRTYCTRTCYLTFYTDHSFAVAEERYSQSF